MCARKSTSARRRGAAAAWMEGREPPRESAACAGALASAGRGCPCTPAPCHAALPLLTRGAPLPLLQTGIPVLGVVENMSGLRVPLSAFRFYGPAGEDVTEAVLAAAGAAAAGPGGGDGGASSSGAGIVAETCVFHASGGGAARMAADMQVGQGAFSAGQWAVQQGARECLPGAAQRVCWFESGCVAVRGPPANHKLCRAAPHRCPSWAACPWTQPSAGPARRGGRCLRRQQAAAAVGAAAPQRCRRSSTSCWLQQMRAPMAWRSELQLYFSDRCIAGAPPAIQMCPVRAPPMCHVPTPLYPFVRPRAWSEISTCSHCN